MLPTGRRDVLLGISSVSRIRSLISFSLSQRNVRTQILRSNQIVDSVLQLPLPPTHTPSLFFSTFTWTCWFLFLEDSLGHYTANHSPVHPPKHLLIHFLTWKKFKDSEGFISKYTSAYYKNIELRMVCINQPRNVFIFITYSGWYEIAVYLNK